MSTVYNSQLDSFTLHHLIREPSSQSSQSSEDGTLLTSLAHALSGSTGSALSNVVTYPLDLIITRLQIQRQLRKNAAQASDNEYRGFQDAAKKIYENEGGYKGFFQGVKEDTFKTIADSFLFFLFYSFLRDRRLKRAGHGGQLHALEELSVGFVAGAVTKAVTTPIANVVTRKQAATMTGGAEEAKKSAREVLQEILDDKGTAGLWSGYSASLILTLNPSLTFFLFEMFKRVTLKREERDKPHPVMTFLLSAISKSVASSVTYPFSLAKSRLQVGGKKESDEERQELEKDVQNTKERKFMEDTIFGTIYAIIEKEGWTSLYEGLELEVVKGFLSHGITMLVKQAIQRLLVRLAYVASIVLGRYRKKLSGTRMKQRAQETVEYYNLGMARAAERIEVVVEEAQSTIREKANETAEFVSDYIGEEGEAWKELYGPLGLSKWLGGDRDDR